MGHIISAVGLKPDPEKVKAMKEMPPPNNKGRCKAAPGFYTVPG